MLEDFKGGKDRSGHLFKLLHFIDEKISPEK